MSKKSLLVFDADSMVFTVAWRFRTKKAKNLVKLNINKFISDVLRHANVDDYIGFYGAKGGKKNFRYDVYPKYKANRPPTPDFVTKWGPVIRTEFEDKWGFVPVEGMEADDAVAIAVEKHKDDYDEIYVATFDKDLKQIPCVKFYNMKDHTIEDIDAMKAARSFYMQLLTGDSGDNIPGLKGVGKVGATKLLKDCDNEMSLFITVARKYKSNAEDILAKELTAITKTITDELADVEVDTSESVYNGLTGARLERKIRINSKQQLQDKLDETMKGGWKAYYKQQYALLRMLTEEPEDFTTPDPQASPVKKDDPEEKAKSLPKDVDSFLTI